MKYFIAVDLGYYGEETIAHLCKKEGIRYRIIQEKGTKKTGTKKLTALEDSNLKNLRARLSQAEKANDKREIRRIHKEIRAVLGFGKLGKRAYVVID